ncbi:hypothetical protein TNCV_4081401 [Trichonephila clavipes]|nr:hypothetical protein TNCV_4081401 [Trichonephila clavipes]
MWLRDSSLPCAQSACNHGQWGDEVGATGPSGRRFLLHPAITDPHHSCFVSSNTLTDFSEGQSTIPIGNYSSSVEFRNLVNRDYVLHEA